MKTQLTVILILLTINIFPHAKNIQTGMYLVGPADSCTGQNTEFKVKYLSDTICLERNPIITIEDIESCSADSALTKEGKLYSLNIKLTESAGLRVKEISTRNVGKKLAIVINKKIVSVPKINDPITSGSVAVFKDSFQSLKELEKELKHEMKK
jgi:preprotein translocase subunit SecD